MRPGAVAVCLASLLVLALPAAGWPAASLDPSAELQTADPDRVEVKGSAPLLAGNIARSRQLALVDALRQALAASGMLIDSRTLIDKGVVRSDQMWATAQGRITDFAVVDEWQDRDRLHLVVTARIAPATQRDCPASAATPVSLGVPLLDIDPAVDPLIVDALLSQLSGRMRRAFAAEPWEASRGAAPRPLAAARSASEIYAALAYAPPPPASGAYLRPYLRLEQQRRARGAGTAAEWLSTAIGIEVIDAASGEIMSRSERSLARPLAAPGWQYLPAALRPPRRAVAPDVASLLDAVIADTRRSLACRAQRIAVLARQGDMLLLASGSALGLQVGELVQLGGARAAGLDWPIAEITEIGPHGARARLLDDRSELPLGPATRLR